MIKVIEHYLQGKSKVENNCEDGLFINDYYVAVIDGVTSKGKQRWQGYTSGGYAKEILLDTLASAEPTLTATQMMELLNDSLAEAYSQEVIEDDLVEWLRASIIVYSDFYKEVWVFGDCQCCINNMVYRHDKKIDELLSSLRTLTIESALKRGDTLISLQERDKGREAILPFLKLQLDFENTDYKFGYSVLNGHNIDLKQLVIYPIKIGDEIILASDGYPKLYRTLEESEAFLKEVLEKDPLCYTIYPSTKGVVQGYLSYDDRCYVRFEVI